MSRRWRAFHPGVASKGDQVTLSKEESHHIQRVLRLAVGDPVDVFDGAGREWAATIVETTGRVTVEAGEPIDRIVEPALAVTVFQGLCRQDRMDWAVQKLTEIGAVGIQALGCHHAERFPPDEKRLLRWHRIAVEACKQSGRARVPTIEAAGWLPDATPGIPALLLDPAAAASPLAAQLPPGAAEAVWIAAGPESGFTPEEAVRAADAGWRRVSLGPRILRSESAGVVATAVVLYACGDLGR